MLLAKCSAPALTTPVPLPKTVVFAFAIAGPLCAVCEPGRFGDTCSKCPTRQFATLLVFSIVLGYVLLIGFTIYRVCGCLSLGVGTVLLTTIGTLGEHLAHSAPAVQSFVFRQLTEPWFWPFATRLLFHRNVF